MFMPAKFDTPGRLRGSVSPSEGLPRQWDAPIYETINSGQRGVDLIVDFILAPPTHSQST